MTDAMTYFRAGDDVPAYLIRRTPKSEDHKLGTITFSVGCTAVTIGENIWLLPDDPETDEAIITIEGAEHVNFSASSKTLVFGRGCAVLEGSDND